MKQLSRAGGSVFWYDLIITTLELTQYNQHIYSSHLGSNIQHPLEDYDYGQYHLDIQISHK
jgi:hypothetical protein